MGEPVTDPVQVLHLTALSSLQIAGFSAASSTSASLLTDTLERYIFTLARQSVSRAETNGRNGSSVNAWDVGEALGGLGQGGIDELRDWADEMLMGDRAVSVVKGRGVEAIGDLAKQGRILDRQAIEYHYLAVPSPKASPELDSDAEQSDDEMDINTSPASLKRKRSIDDDQDEGYESGGEIQPERVKSIVSDSWLEDWMPRLPGTGPGAAVDIEVDAQAPTVVVEDDPMEMASIANLSTSVPAATPTPVLDPGPTSASTDSFNRSQLDSYLQPIPFSTSMLKESHPLTQLSISRPPLAERKALPRGTSSFPALLRAYTETANDPSMNLSVKPLRQAAAWFLIQGASNPETYTPPDTLFASPVAVPMAPRACPIVPVHPVPNPTTGVVPTYPLPLLPLDPHPPTHREIVAHPPPLLSTLVRDLAGQSPFLPRSLRDRLTSLRPPNPLNGAYYGQPVEAVSGTGVQLRATWDAGRGDFRDGRLPSGRKVVREKVGHEGPIGGAGKVVLKMASLSPLPAPMSAPAAVAVQAAEGETLVQIVESVSAPERAGVVAREDTSSMSMTTPTEAPKKAGGLKLKLFARPGAVSPNPST